MVEKTNTKATKKKAKKATKKVVRKTAKKVAAKKASKGHGMIGKRNRQKYDANLETRIQIRCMKAKRERWHEAAKADPDYEADSFSDWATNLFDKSADEILGSE